MISPVVVMATWSALSGGIWDSGRRVLVCCRRRWRTCCRFWALVRLDFFIVTRLLQGAIVLALPMVSTRPHLPHSHLDTYGMLGITLGVIWAYRHTWMIPLALEEDKRPWATAWREVEG